MPRKDGSPTAAERKNAERIEGNRRFVLEDNRLPEIPTYTLEQIRPELAEDNACIAIIDAELERRTVTA